MMTRVESWLPRRSSATLRALGRDMDRVLSAWLRGQLICCAILAVYYAAALSAIGLDLGLTVGLVSGFAGTATSIGGPPMAILYQRHPPRQIRTTLAVYFMIGAGLSLAGLGLAGQLDMHRALLAACLAPVLPVGAVLGRTLRSRLPAHRVRPAVLAVCAASATALLVKSLL